jgi:hypothetical protein
MCSGMSFHNLREFGLDPNPDSDRFDAWLTDAACTPDPEERAAKLAQWKNAPGRARPTLAKNIRSHSCLRQAQPAKTQDTGSSTTGSCSDSERPRI